MPTYLHPGVYIEEIPSGVKPIEAVGTSTAVFIGYTTKGPVAEPLLIQKWDDYDDIFGGIRDVVENGVGDPMGYGVNSFFKNGGKKTYIVRIVEGGTAECSEGYIRNPVDDQELLKITAANPGSWGDELVVKLESKGIDGLYTLQVGKMEDGEFKELEKFTDLTLTDNTQDDYIDKIVNDGSQLVEVEMQDVTPYLLGISQSQDLSGLNYEDLNEKTMTVTVDGTDRPVTFAAGTFVAESTLDDVATKIAELVHGQVTASNPIFDFTCVAVDDTLLLTSGTHTATSSVVVTGPGDATDASIILLLGVDNEGTERTGQESLDLLLAGGNQATLAGGEDGEKPTEDEYQDVFSKLEKERGVNILCLPGQTWSTADVAGQSIIDSAVAHAEKMKNRMLIIDLLPTTELTTEKGVTDLGLKPKTYSVVYYPWTKVANQHYDPEKKPGAPKTVLVAPSGFAAGTWAKIDGSRGVWKAPAGVETSLLGVSGLNFLVEDGEQDQLNPHGINCFRKMPGYGPVIWGTRTLATKANPEWRYIPIRRTAMMIEQSIYENIQWAVFEPNNHLLWASLRINIGSFMDGLFRAGAFQGEKASDAYFVRCNLGDTMTQDDIDRGQVIVIVGFAPLKPAEFVIIRIQQKVAQQ